MHPSRRSFEIEGANFIKDLTSSPMMQKSMKSVVRAGSFLLRVRREFKFVSMCPIIKYLSVEELRSISFAGTLYGVEMF